jgi:ribosomal protein L35AE/L33A
VRDRFGVSRGVAILPVLMRRLLVVIALFALPGLAPSAAAQVPDPAPDPDPPEVCCAPDPEPKPRPSEGKLTLTFRNGLRKDGRVYLTKGQRVKIRGRARPFVRGQYVRINLRRNGKTVASRVRRLRKHGRRGQFVVRFKPRVTGGYSIRARHKRSRRQRRFKAREHARVVDNTAGIGSRGIRVKMLQRGLKRLGYAGFSATGYYGPGTARAVLAFHKVNHMPRTGFASREVFQKVFERRGTFRLKYPRARKHIEADLSRQVLVLAKNGKPARIYHMSSGKPSTPTVLGSFRVYSRTPGTNSHGMVHSSYFVGGYAIHGYHSVPTYPASHGCLRVPIPSAWSIYSWIDFGDRVFVYR